VRRRRARALLGAAFVATGASHLRFTDAYEAIVPRALPARRALVHVSGLAELAGGAGLIADRTARPAGLWLVALLAAVFPANVSMALRADEFTRVPRVLLWARLPLQGVFAWAVWRTAVRRPGAR